MSETKEAGRRVHWIIYCVPFVTLIITFLVIGHDAALGTPDFGISNDSQFKNAFIAILALLYLVTFLAFISGSSSTEALEVEPVYVPAETKKESPKPKADAKKAESTPEKAGKKRIVEYPKKETGCIYSNTLIPINKNLVLNLRVFVAKSCMLCDDQESCWAGFKNSVNYKDFMANTECKDGLTGKAKTASQIGFYKEKEEKAKA